MTRLVFPRSHAFPGGRVAVEDRDDAPACTVEFGDGTALVARVREGTPHRLVVEIPAHATARGTPIAAATWRIARGDDGVWRSRRAG